MRNSPQRGFTLIELSIALVVIGLIIGGILVGQDLIGAAAVRAQVAQIEKYNTAVNTFVGKYGGFPGDLNATLASQFGFTSRGGTQGQGDGNGIIEGWSFISNAVHDWYQTGEPYYFWEDLSSANFIDAKLSTYVSGATPTAPTNTAFSSLVPYAKISQKDYVYVYSNNGTNYLTIAAPIMFQNDGNNTAAAGLTVNQNYAIDKKIDDGLPQNGSVTAQLIYYGIIWASGMTGTSGAAPGTAASGSSSTCYDNGGNASNPMQYSMEIANGSNPNCALSFKMQGAAR